MTEAAEPYVNNPLAEKFSGSWRDYVEIGHYADFKHREQIEKTLDLMVRDVPEFRELLCASQQPYLTHDEAGEPKRQQKIKISENIAFRGTDFDKITSSRAMLEERLTPAGVGSVPKDVMIKPQYINNAKYKGADGKHHAFSMQRSIFHEFVHIIDPKMLKFKEEQQEFGIQKYVELSEKYKIGESKYSFINIYREAKVQSELKKAVTAFNVEKVENYVVARTNAAMSRHYDEVPRAGYVGKVQWFNVFKREGTDPIIHEKSVHEEGFVPVPIADAVDPERITLARDLADKAKEAIAQEMQFASEDADEITKPSTFSDDREQDKDDSPDRSRFS